MKKHNLFAVISISVMTALVFTSCGKSGTGTDKSSISTEVTHSSESTDSTQNSETRLIRSRA